MIKGSTILIVGAGAAAVLFGASYLLKVNRLSAELESTTKASIHKVTLEGIELNIEVTLKNPSGGSIVIKHPFVKLMYQDKTIATSTIKDVNITVKKFSEVNLEPIKVMLKFLNMATTVPQLLKNYRSTGKLELTVKTVTTINDTLPYTKTDVIILGSGKQA